MKVYVDNRLVKSKKPELYLADLREAFLVLRRYQMKLNQSKYAFRVELRKFLGFMVSKRGIEANPEKVKAIVGILSPHSLHKVQKLASYIATLNYFIAWLID